MDKEDKSKSLKRDHKLVTKTTRSFEHVDQSNRGSRAYPRTQGSENIVVQCFTTLPRRC